MKLTKVGADYHGTILVLAAVGLFSGGVLFSALALSLAFTSLLSLALMLGRAPKQDEITVVGGGVRTLKNEQASLRLTIPRLKDRWTGAEIESVQVEGPVSCSIIPLDQGEAEVLLRPLAAGRFTQAKVSLGLRDVLGLFSYTRVVTLQDLEIDSIPLSLLARPSRAFVPPLTVGESPSGVAGRGQEFYGIEMYTERSESRDILWKRAAKEPDRPLLARVREANNPEYVWIDVIHGRYALEGRHELVDLQCEALGILGRSLLPVGVSMVIVGPNAEPLFAEADEDLVEAIMEVSTQGRPVSEPRPRSERSAVVIVVGEMPDDTIAAAAGRPLVLIGGRLPLTLDRRSVRFTGTEDLSGIVNLVLAR